MKGVKLFNAYMYMIKYILSNAFLNAKLYFVQTGTED